MTGIRVHGCRVSTSVHDSKFKLLTAKMYASSDSVLSLCEKCQPYPESTPAWKSEIDWSRDTNPRRELDSIDGEPVVFEWKIFPGHTTLEFVQEIQKFMKEELKRTPQDFKHRIIFMSIYNDIEWTRKDHREVCLNNSSSVAEYAKSFSKGH